MAAEEVDSGRGFTVVDKRGREKDEPGGAQAESAAGTGGPDPASAAEGDAQLPEIDFSTFILSLGTSALYHMGLVQDPESGSPAEPNLPLARQTIDTLAMLEAKTRGNLDRDEAHLLESLLYELRMRYVEANK